MNAYERFKGTLNGLAVDRIPNFDIMMTFAAHYINAPLARYYQDYRVLCEANWAVIDVFELDIAQAISDPYRETVDLGGVVEFPDDGLPVLQKYRLEHPDDLASLRPIDPTQGRRMTDRLDAVRLFRERVGGTMPIMGWVEGALAEAADLRGVSNLLTDVYDRPEWLLDVLEVCTEVAIAFAKAQIAAGADIIGLGDAIASQISPRMYQKYALPYEKRIFEAVHEMGGIARLHICGDTTKILPYMGQSGADIIDLDWMVSIPAAVDTFGGQIAICGNFDPVRVMLQGTPDQVRVAVRDCAKQACALYFSAAGCEIPDRTPHANLLAQAQVLREWGNGQGY